MSRPSAIYSTLQGMARDDIFIADVVLGLVWVYVEVQQGERRGFGLAMRPDSYTRTLPWSGQLAGKPAAEVLGWFDGWDFHETAVALATANAVIDLDRKQLSAATSLPAGSNPNLAVFEHFRPQLAGKKVVVIGRYPGMETLEEELDLTVLERRPDPRSLPDSAAEALLPGADWVFLTASSLVNRTFPRLLELSRQARLVLMGPSTPMLAVPELLDVDYLCGVRVNDPELLKRTVAEGGGVRIFDSAISSCVLDTRAPVMSELKNRIGEVWAERDSLKQEMEQWYTGSGQGRFPRRGRLDELDRELSELDSHYKRLWDAVNTK